MFIENFLVQNFHHVVKFDRQNGKSLVEISLTLPKCIVILGLKLCEIQQYRTNRHQNNCDNSEKHL